MMPCARIALVCALTLLASCAPPAGVMAPVVVEDGERYGTPSGKDELRSKWWDRFSDPVLSAYVAEALERNHDVRLAAQRVAEARAMQRAQGAALAPTIGFGGGATRGRSVSDVTLEPYLSTGWQGQFEAAYEVDLWGRLGALETGARLTADASDFQRDATALGVAASTASAYITLRGLDSQLEVARRTLVSREQSLALVQRRLDAGWGSALELSQAQAELRSAAAAVPALHIAINRQERVLNLLLGRRPGPLARGQTLEAIDIPPVPDVGVPSALARRRPDIAASERQLGAADAQWHAARAQLLPSLRLTASLGRVGASVLRDDPFTIWSIGGSILAPILNGGRLRALADASGSRREQALVGYERAVLTAFTEVEGQLREIQEQKSRGEAIELQYDAIAQTYRQARQRHHEGYVSYLDELVAQRGLYVVEQSRIQARTDLLLANVSLYRALGGGWSEEASTPERR